MVLDEYNEFYVKDFRGFVSVSIVKLCKQII